MEVVRKINDELAIAGIVTVQQFYQVAEEGFRSVLNLRSLDRDSLANEQRSVERLGLCYVNLPIDQEAMSPEIAWQVLKQIGKLPKPSLVCCNNAMLAAAVVLMYIAIGQGEPLQKAFKRAEDLGLFTASLQAATF